MVPFEQALAGLVDFAVIYFMGFLAVYLVFEFLLVFVRQPYMILRRMRYSARRTTVLFGYIAIILEAGYLTTFYIVQPLILLNPGVVTVILAMLSTLLIGSVLFAILTTDKVQHRVIEFVRLG